MSIHPEDALAYADELHRDLVALTKQVQRIADVLENVGADGKLTVTGKLVTALDAP